MTTIVERKDEDAGDGGSYQYALYVRVDSSDS